MNTPSNLSSLPWTTCIIVSQHANIPCFTYTQVLKSDTAICICFVCVSHDWGVYRGIKNDERKWFLLCCSVLETCEWDMPVAWWSLLLSKLTSGEKLSLNASLCAHLSAVVWVFTEVRQLTLSIAAHTFHISTRLFWVRSQRYGAHLHSTGWIRKDVLCSPGMLTVLSFIHHHQDDLLHLCSSFFWLAWYFLQLSCSMVRASGSVFFSEESCSWGLCWFWTLRPLISMHWYIRLKDFNAYG